MWPTALHMTMHRQEHLSNTNPDQLMDLDTSGQEASCESHLVKHSLLRNP